MQTTRDFIIIGVIFGIFSLSVPVVGDDGPHLQVDISGNESTISEVLPGIFHAEILKVNPVATVLFENKTVFIPIPYALPSNTSTGFMNTVNNTGDMMTFMIQATDIRLSEEKQTIHLEMIPLEFYEGSSRAPDHAIKNDIVPGSYSITNLTLEYAVPASQNTPGNYCCTFEEIDNHKCRPLRPLCGY